MLTLRLNDASEIKVSDKGFTTSVIKLDGIVTNAVTFTTEQLPLDNVQSYFKNSEKTATLRLLNEEGIPVSNMDGYTRLCGIQVDLDGDDEKYTVTMAQPTDLEGLKNALQTVLTDLGTTKTETVQKVQSMNETMLETEKRVNKSIADSAEFQTTTTNDISNVKKELGQTTSTVNETKTKVDDITKQLAPPDPETMELMELKAYCIAQSKLNLAAWLADHPLTSSAHKETPGVYSVTAEKQSLLQAAIMVAQLQKAADNDGYKVSWNETGKECENDWTLEELTQLALEISEYVHPYVTAQQAKETAIMAAEDKEGVNAVDLTYDHVAQMPLA